MIEEIHKDYYLIKEFIDNYYIEKRGDIHDLGFAIVSNLKNLKRRLNFLKEALDKHERGDYKNIYEKMMLENYIRCEYKLFFELLPPYVFPDMTIEEFQIRIGCSYKLLNKDVNEC
ncbi:hypothetical protein [Candidatus Sulfurimonas baltica]|uniref:Uncharacterized protein n=1 Tax=Candidatus Sulfurimonas baltica TaxID=2740404 RepID=A0A7S7LXI8_9BACT|nr:hypothetical protein [Candidatus Sulfurimonas baltica]QOY53251.1 hypothetical protein HUE88_06105 [Candidatus Sulfurimonas baltica]